MTTDGYSEVSGLARWVVINVNQLEPLQLTRRGIMMELSSDWTIDYSSLKAGVGVTKKYRGCHRSRAVCDKVLPAAEVSSI
jgi:hypothetical protein